MIPCNCKLASFVAKSFNKQKSYIQGIPLNAVIVGFKEFQVVFTVSSFVGNPVNINIINMLPAVGI